jgi:hypothetical protein
MAMSSCLRREELAALAAVPPGDSRRSHVDACPRCSARLLSYQQFLAPEALPSSARAAQSSAVLEEVLRKEILGRAAPGAVAQEHRDGVRRWGRLRALLWRPILRPVWAVAVIAVITGVAFQVRPWDRHPDHLRGASPVAPPTIQAESRITPEGILLSWVRPPGTTRSLVVLRSADLSELARVDAGEGSSVNLPTDRLAPTGSGSSNANGAGPGARYWRVLCLRGVEEVGRSSLQELPGRRAAQRQSPEATKPPQ